MKSTNALKRKVDELQKQAEEIEELGVRLLEEAILKYPRLTQATSLSLIIRVR